MIHDEAGGRMREVTNSEIIDAWSDATNDAIAFGEEGDFAHKYLLNPAIFALLRNLEGMRVLDAGCGQGYLSRMMARRGAMVTGIEPAAALRQYAVERELTERLGISYRQEDLSSLSKFDTGFDAVVAHMVFMDIPDYESAVANCIAALKPGGDFVFSLLYPCFEEPSSEWPRKGCVEVREYLAEYATHQRFGSLFHRPLSSYINLVIREGCILQQMVEPRLSPELAVQDESYERNVHVPSFIVIHARKV